MTPILLKDEWLRPITAAKQDAQAEVDKLDISKKCCCLEYRGDNPDCPKHGHLYREYRQGDPGESPFETRRHVGV